jgi:hypothetical protein
MTLDEFRLLIPEYLAGQLSGAEKVACEEFAKVNPEARLELAELRGVWDELGAIEEEQPSAALRAKFYQKLYALDKPKRTFNWMQIAAALAVFVLGAAAGRFKPDSEVRQMRGEMRSLHETVALSLLEQESATSRLQGVEWSSQVDRPDEELRTALVRTLNEDPNVNVRLASLDALEKFSDEPAVRKSLVASIGRQDSPLVQIALIDAVVHMHDRAAGMQLKQVTTDSAMNAAVRQRAQWGLQKLGL